MDKISLAWSPELSQVTQVTPTQKALAIHAALPAAGLFANKLWRIAPESLRLAPPLFQRLTELGSRLHSFNKACNLLYRQSVEGKQPGWIAGYLEAGKPPQLIETARHPRFKNDIPCVIRPDLLLTESGFSIAELDSVPGGIGLTAWLQKISAQISQSPFEQSLPPMLKEFLAALKSMVRTPHSQDAKIAIVVSEEAREYRPEMEWIIAQNDPLQTFQICTPEALEYKPEGVFLKGQRLDLIYRFFELFDLPNIPHIEKLISLAKEGLIQITPPIKPQLEEKLWFALFWFPQLADFWRRELGERYFKDLKEIIPFTWLLDPAPLPPQGVIPHLEIHDWSALMNFSQKQRDLILKISGFSDKAWGSRGVHLGSDMPADQWKELVTRSLAEFETHPYILQRFCHSRLIEHPWCDLEKEKMETLKGRVRLCPYYFIQNDKPVLGGVLATICPADKKLLHGMEEAILTLAICD